MASSLEENRVLVQAAVKKVTGTVISDLVVNAIAEEVINAGFRCVVGGMEEQWQYYNPERGWVEVTDKIHALSNAKYFGHNRVRYKLRSESEWHESGSVEPAAFDWENRHTKLETEA